MRTRHGVQHTITSWIAMGALYSVLTDASVAAGAMNEHLARCLGFTRYCLDKLTRHLGGALEKVAGQNLATPVTYYLSTISIKLCRPKGCGQKGCMYMLRAELQPGRPPPTDLYNTKREYLDMNWLAQYYNTSTGTSMPAGSYKEPYRVAGGCI